MRVLLINGPNMSRLDIRGDKYNASYTQLVATVSKYAQDLDIHVDFVVSDIEGELVKCIGESLHDAIIINAAAYSHYSIAIRDALESYKGKKIEVHMTNIYARESFRHKSMLSSVVDGAIVGFGVHSYVLALYALVSI